MNKISTQDQILLKAYNDISLLDELALDSTLSFNESLSELLAQIRSTQVILDSALCNPHPTSIQLVLEASLRSQLETY